jgi:glutamyl-tRNA synthetase
MIDEKEFVEKITLFALENAVQFNGKANPKAILGKAIQAFPLIKQDMGTYVPKINTLCENINAKSLEEQTKILLEKNPQYFEEQNKKKEPNKRDGLPELPDTDKPVIVRFPPAPSGHLHLGHLFGIVANYELKKKCGGKFILRFEDTNPDNIDISNYDKVIEDVQWITDNGVDEIVYQSDRMEIYYKYLRTLVETGFAYICKCDAETFKAYTDAKEMCPCQKEISIETHIKKYEKMFTRYQPGEAVIRAKADIQNKNPALRTFPLARINTNKHARVGTKYRVWPNYNLACAIDDSIMNLTHVIRGKDLEIGEERQKMLHKALGLKSPHYYHYGRMKFEDMELSKSKLSELIAKGKYSGWSDPRLPTIIAHRKRGYRAEAFRKFILHLGISKRDSKITSKEYYKGLDYFNKQILEKEANRYFFVYNPKRVHIININEISDKEINLPKHPEDKSKGSRKFSVEQEYYINGVDFEHLEKGDKFRLMHFGNFSVESKTEQELTIKFISKEYSKEFGAKRNIDFVPKSEHEKATIILADNSKLHGITEKLDNLKQEENVQFERFGFVKYDGKEKDTKLFYFTHK